jgi:hypothetical protein
MLAFTMHITIGYTSHSMETIPYMEQLMADYDLIITEEAPAPGFSFMLDKKIPIKKYIEEEQLEFPQFSKRYYKLLRILHRNGKKILQLEPYMERLMRIYAMFSDGKYPADVMKIPALKKVYEAEKKATAALLAFYEHSMRAPFPYLLETVRQFAKADAEKFRLRDLLRANAVAEVVKSEQKRIFIEAGSIHVYLERELKRKLKRTCRIDTVNLLGNHIRELTGKMAFFPPGDILTIHYILRKKEDKALETLLAARSLIYIKLLRKEEMSPYGKTRVPHLEDKIGVTALTGDLTVEECSVLFRKIRFQGRKRALEIVKEHRKSR